MTPSAVQSVKINSDPYSAEFSRPGRGRIEITTKTPDPVFHGTANVIFRDAHFDARNAFASTRAPEQRRIFEGVLTGPVPRLSRTFFLLSADYQQDNLQSIVFAQLPSGLLQENVPSPVRAKDLAARLSHDFTDHYTGALQFTFESRSRQNQLWSGQPVNAGQNPNGGGGSGQNQANGGYILPEAGRNVTNLERHLTYSDRLVLRPTLLNQFQIMYERNRDSIASTTEQSQISVQNSFVAGGAQATQLATENNVDIRDVLTWTHKAHTVSTGFAMPNFSRRGLDDHSNRLGTFNFSSRGLCCRASLFVHAATRTGSFRLLAKRDRWLPSGSDPRCSQPSINFWLALGLAELPSRQQQLCAACINRIRFWQKSEHGSASRRRHFLRSYERKTARQPGRILRARSTEHSLAQSAISKSVHQWDRSISRTGQSVPLQPKYSNSLSGHVQCFTGAATLESGYDNGNL